MDFETSDLRDLGRFRETAPVPDGLVDFASNDYLGLSDVILNTDTPSFGSTGSRLLAGDHALFHDLEHLIATDLGTESALFFNSGYQANLGIISTLFGPEDAIFSDKLCHASMIDGIRLSGASHHRFAHGNLEHLNTLLQKHRATYKKVLIVSETVFSMDGDIALISDLIQLKHQFHTYLMLDDAHAIGAMGTRGLGVCAGRAKDIDLIVGTFGKALGSSGAYVACTQALRDYLVNYCRSFIYSTALPLPVISRNIAAWKHMTTMDAERNTLHHLSHYFRQLLTDRFSILGNTHIVPLVVGDVYKAVELSSILKDVGFWVPAIRPPTVPEGRARLRFSLRATHTENQLKDVANVLRHNR